MDVVIEFKRDVYMKALQELSRFLTRPQHHGQRRARDRAPDSAKPLAETEDHPQTEPGIK
jgi:putative (di)nucleoside polyphosphate hydrolase